LDLVDWPSFETLPVSKSDPEQKVSAAEGEHVVRLECGLEVSVSSALLRRRYTMPLADCIEVLESETDTETGTEAYVQLMSLDHLLDMADVYAEHSGCIGQYVEFFETRLAA
jgi:hypothetical protein